MIKEELLKGLSADQIKRLKGCKSSDEVFRLAKQEGIELTDEQLESVSGGNCLNDPTCPQCKERVPYDSGTNDFWFTCPNCGHKFRDASMGHLS